MSTKLISKPKILILGAGYAGTRVAKHLALNLKNAEIILIDKAKSHAYLAELYEVSTAYYKKRTKDCLIELKDTVSFPVELAFRGLPVRFVYEEVISISPEKQTVTFSNKKSLSFDYLVVTLGSVNNYYNISGLENNVYTLKSVSQALQINRNLESALIRHFKLKPEQDFNIHVGGGGFTGAEIVCELRFLCNKLSKKYNFNPEKIKISIIQALPEMIGLGQKVHSLTIKRLKQLNITPHLNTVIISFKCQEFGKGKIELKQDNQQKFITTDFFIWTAGIKPHPIISKSFPTADQTGAIPVNSFLQSEKYPNIFAGGDCATVINPKTQKPCPKTGQFAIQHGAYIGKNLAALLEQKPLIPFKPHFKGFVIQLGGKYAIYARGNIAFGGFLPWIMRKYVDLAYYLSILPPIPAIKKWFTGVNVFLQND